MRQSINFAGLAKRLLQGGGFTTYTLGKELGLSQSAVSRLATGRTNSVSADVGLGLIELCGGAVTVPAEPQRASHVTE